MYRTNKVVAVCFGVVATLFHLPGYAGSISFNVEGRGVKTITSGDLARLLPLVQLKVRNPENGKDITYEGYPLVDVLKTAFGTDWPRYETIEFGCTDGYRPAMATNKALQHQGLIAIRENGKSTLAPLQRANGTVVDLGTFYLVWENIHDIKAGKSTELSWPWQLESISLRGP